MHRQRQAAATRSHVPARQSKEPTPSSALCARVGAQVIPKVIVSRLESIVCRSPAKRIAFEDVPAAYKTFCGKGLNLGMYGFLSVTDLIEKGNVRSLVKGEHYMELSSKECHMNQHPLAPETLEGSLLSKHLAQAERLPCFTSPLAPLLPNSLADDIGCGQAQTCNPSSLPWLASFDVRTSFALVPAQDLEAAGRADDALRLAPVSVTDDAEELLLSRIPAHLAEAVRSLKANGEAVSDIQLDVDRLPCAYASGTRRALASQAVSFELIDSVCAGLAFGPDNRASLNGQLHRISRITSDQADGEGGQHRGPRIVGLTMRIGRLATGRAHLFADVLLGSSKSLLVLGAPGAGKSTVVREVCALLAGSKNVVAIDPSKELGGDGDVPHRALGNARRMQVGQSQTQAGVMLECVKNHTPDVVVIDEIGGAEIAQAARECKTRGVRIIASAHGSLRSLVASDLKELVGGVSTVTIGDGTAKAFRSKRGPSGMPSKLHAQRVGAPVFDVIVELRPGDFTSLLVIRDTAAAVDAILDGWPVPGAQRRARMAAPAQNGVLDTRLEVWNE